MCTQINTYNINTRVTYTQMHTRTHTHTRTYTHRHTQTHTHTQTVHMRSENSSDGGDKAIIGNPTRPECYCPVSHTHRHTHTQTHTHTDTHTHTHRHTHTQTHTLQHVSYCSRVVPGGVAVAVAVVAGMLEQTGSAHSSD